MSLSEGLANIASPSEPGASTCGYCSPPGQRSEKATSYHSATLHAYLLSSSVYQRMIDRGWRRSGKYCYKPNLRISCCPQYTIRLDALQFNPTRSQRKLLNRWNRYVLYGESHSKTMKVDQTGEPPAPKPCRKAPKSSPYTTLSAAIHESETGVHQELEPAHAFTVTIEPSSYTAEKVELYKKYQSEIHHDKENAPSGFKRFLVDSPLNVEPIQYSSEPPSHLPKNYGSYHQLYRLDGKLIAMGVIDVLPSCVSSVYFMYDNNWEKYSMGKISALREISLAREIREAGAPDMGYLYMGFYIYSCQKMRYKGDYAPSFLADPETYEWYPLDSCISSLQKHRYACFSDPSHSSMDDEILEDLAANSQLPVLPTDSSEFTGIRILTRGETGQTGCTFVEDTGYLSLFYVRDELGSCVRGLGKDIASEVVFAL